MTRSSSRQLLSIIGPTLFVGTLAMFQVGCNRKDDTEAGAPSTTTAAPSDDAQMQAGLDDLYKTGDANAAIDVFREVLKNNPTHYGARYQLAKALDMAGKPQEARPVWQQVLVAADNIHDTASAQAARARLAAPDTVSEAGMMAIGLNMMYKQNNPAGAADQFRKVLQKNPTHYGATFQLAKALDQQGKKAEARPYWQKVVTMADAIKDKTTADTARGRLQR
jgi:cytochrome c-type biogenesis protein CcmH/NrfG